METMETSIRSIMNLMGENDIQLVPVYLVEQGTGINEPAMHSVHENMVSLLCQFTSGLRPDRVLYIGHNKAKAELIYNTYLKASIHARGIVDHRIRFVDANNGEVV